MPHGGLRTVCSRHGKASRSASPSELRCQREDVSFRVPCLPSSFTSASLLSAGRLNVMKVVPGSEQKRLCQALFIRQLELQRQAEEAQRLRKRKRAEATRKFEMERRQKQCLEEMQKTQKKNEEIMDLKEQLRGQVRAKLEQVASKCKDMASLLRFLGVSVEGGPSPLSQQVNAAYKQALLRFHPDRSSKSDLRHQVEAEETFKLISRLKDTLLPVAATYLNRTSR